MGEGHLQTTLAPTKEAVAVALRKTLLISLDDLLAVVRAFLHPNVSTAASERCLKAITSTLVKSWKPRCTAMSGSPINNSRINSGQHVALAGHEGMAQN